jgi:hypothetical protein
VRAFFAEVQKTLARRYSVSDFPDQTIAQCIDEANMGLNVSVVVGVAMDKHRAAVAAIARRKQEVAVSPKVVRKPPELVKAPVKPVRAVRRPAKKGSPWTPSPRKYWYYRSSSSHAIVHFEGCSFCNEGHGVHQGADASRWVGPFESRRKAMIQAKRTTRVVRYCEHCGGEAAMEFADTD